MFDRSDLYTLQNSGQSQVPALNSFQELSLHKLCDKSHRYSHISNSNANNQTEYAGNAGSLRLLKAKPNKLKKPKKPDKPDRPEKLKKPDRRAAKTNNEKQITRTIQNVGLCCNSTLHRVVAV